MRSQGRRYKTSWEYLPSLKGSIQRDANNPNMSYCVHCKKVLEPKLSTLKGHVLTRFHQHQVEMARRQNGEALQPRATSQTFEQAQIKIFDTEEQKDLTLLDDHDQAQTVPAWQCIEHNYGMKTLFTRASKFQPDWHDMFKGEIVAHPDSEDLVVCVRCKMVLSCKLDIVSMHYDSYRHCNQKLWNDESNSVETWLLQKKILNIFPRICSYSAFDIPPSESSREIVKTPDGISACVCCEEVVNDVGRHLVGAKHEEARNKQNEMLSERSEEYKMEVVRRLVACFTSIQNGALPETLDYKDDEFSVHPRYKNLMICRSCGAEVIRSKRFMESHLISHAFLIVTTPTRDNHSMLRGSNVGGDVELRPDERCVEMSVVSDNDTRCGLNKGDVILEKNGRQKRQNDDEVDEK